MVYRPFIQLMLSIFIASLISCDEQQNKKSAAAYEDNRLEKKREDSILHSIQEQAKTVIINASKKNLFVSKKGIKISIPENAFVTSSGEKPKGNVSVKISEYHNPADILISGIPMQYKTNNGPVQMESAGMFNIEATAAGKPLQLAKGKEIAMQMPTKNSDTNFNLYYFDASTNEWRQVINNLPIETPEAKVEKEIIQTAPLRSTTEAAAITIEWAAVDNIQRMIDGKNVNLVRPVCLYDDTYFTFPIITNKYPELLLFKESVWTGYSKQDKLKASAAFEMDQLINAEIIERETPLNKYLIRFEFKNIKFEAYMSIASKSDFCEINDEIYFSVYDQRSVDENKIEKIKTKTKIAKKQNEIYRSFSINRLGIWNCDRLYLLTKKATINPRFKNKSNNEFYKPATTYLIDKKINSVWTFSNIVTLNPDSQNLLVFVNEKGRLCYARINNLPQTDSEKPMDVVIDVTELEDNPDNTDELNELLKKS